MHRLFGLILCLNLAFHFLGAQAKRGILDLTSTDLNKETVLLDGEWEIYWNQLLSPEEIATNRTPTDYFTFPELWNKHVTRSGIHLQSTGYATYKLTVILPHERPTIAFKIKHYYTSYRFFVNGENILSNGIVGTTPETTSPRWIPMRIAYPTDSDTLDLVLQVANFIHSKGGTKSSIQLSSYQNIETKFITGLSYDLLLTGCLIMTGLFFLGLYYFGQKEKSALYFSLFCLTLSYRIIASENYALHILYPDYNWLLLLKLEYLSLFIPAMFFALYTHSLYPEDSKHFILKGFAVISGLLAMATLILPSTIFTHFVDPYLFIMLLVIIYGVVVYVAAARQNRGGVRYAILGTIPVFFIFIYKILIYLGKFPEIELITFIGFVAFFFFQSLVLFFLFTKSLKDAKEEAERAVLAKSEFLSMMSHEIRTPMNAVVGLTNYLIDDKPKTGQVDTLNTLKFSAQNLLVIINDILDFSKIEAGKVEFEEQSCDLYEVLFNIKKTFEPAAKDKELEFLLDISEDVPHYILCDITRTAQILSNLIGNAIKFTKKGHVALRVKCLSNEQRSALIHFSIEDTGIGIPVSRQADVFKSFTQANSSINRQFGGTGLGLTITKRLLELQDAELKLESEENIGTKFYFAQHFQITTKPERVKSDSKIISSPVMARVLLVEDNEVNRLVARKFLNKWGINAVYASNGKEAIDLYKEGEFDMILMDLQMPVMDGYEAVRILREMGVKIPIVALTASALLDQHKKIYSAGMDDYITKPFDPDELLGKIQRYSQSD